MSDNILLNLGVGGKTIATDEIATIQHELVKVEFGDDGVATMVSATNPLPVTDALGSTAAKQDTGNTSLASIDGKITAVNTGAVVVASSALPSLASTSTKQSDGSQKTQVVDGSGNVIGATSNALDVNIKSGNPTTITATQATGTNLHTVVDSGTITTVSTVTAVTSITNNVNTVEVVATTIFNGKTTVATAGSRGTLAASQAVKSVTIKALSTNTGFIYVGNSSVTSANGFQLLAGESISMDVANLNTVNIDSSVNGEGVTYIGVN